MLEPREAILQYRPFPIFEGDPPPPFITELGKEVQLALAKIRLQHEVEALKLRLETTQRVMEVLESQA